MSDKYIDPNSGAAPQPGGYATQDGVVADSTITPQSSPAPDPVVEEEAGFEEEVVTPEAEPVVEETQQVEVEPENQRAPEPEPETGDDEGDKTPGEDEAGQTVEEEPVVLTEPDGEPTDVADETETETQTEEPPAPVVEKPAGNASREAWVDYAKSPAGGELTDEQLEGQTRDEIRDLYA